MNPWLKPFVGIYVGELSQKTGFQNGGDIEMGFIHTQYVLFYTSPGVLVVVLKITCFEQTSDQLTLYVPFVVLITCEALDGVVPRATPVPQVQRGLPLKAAQGCPASENSSKGVRLR